MGKKEIWSVGEIVRINFPPGCPQEMNLHGWAKYNNGLRGYIQGVEPERKDGHFYRVAGLRIDGKDRTMWFAPHELEDGLDVPQLLADLGIESPPKS